MASGYAVRDTAPSVEGAKSSWQPPPPPMPSSSNAATPPSKTTHASILANAVNVLSRGWNAISLFVVEPNSSWYTYFLLLLITVGIYNTVTIPLRLAFDTKNDLIFLLIDYLMADVVYLVDIFLNMRCAYYDEGTVQTSKKKITERYRKHGGYLLHVISTLPLEIIAPLTHPSHRVYFRLNRVLRIFTMPKAIEKVERLISKNVNVVRLVKLFFAVMLYIHWVACLWYLVARWEGFSPHTWVVRYDIIELETTDHYIASLYWAMVTFATVGYGDVVPYTRYEKIFSIMAVFFGAAVYASIFGNMTNLIASLDMDGLRYREKLSMLNEYMRYRGLPHSLKDRIRNYYEVIWSRHKGLDESSILNDLPPSLRSDVALYLHHHLVQKVPLFQDCDIPGFINSLVVKLQPQVALPGDYIIRHGEIGREMYFLSKGKVEVISGDGSVVYATLNEGSYFGEIALLFEARRIAHIRTTTYCDLLMLTKDDFDSVLCYFPSLVDEMRQKAKEKIGEQRMQAAERPPMRPAARVSLVPLTEDEERKMNRKQSKGSKKGNSSFRSDSSGSDSELSSDSDFGSVFFKRISSKHPSSQAGSKSTLSRGMSARPLREISKAIRTSIQEVRSTFINRQDSQSVRNLGSVQQSVSQSASLDQSQSFFHETSTPPMHSSIHPPFGMDDADDMKVTIEDSVGAQFGSRSAHGHGHGHGQTSQIGYPVHDHTQGQVHGRSPRTSSPGLVSRSRPTLISDDSNVPSSSVAMDSGSNGTKSGTARDDADQTQPQGSRRTLGASSSLSPQAVQMSTEVGLSSVSGDPTTAIVSMAEIGHGRSDLGKRNKGISGIAAKRAVGDRRYYRARWKAIAYTAIANQSMNEDAGSMQSESPRSVRSGRSHASTSRKPKVVLNPMDKDAMRTVVSGFNTIQEEDNPDAEKLEEIAKPTTFSNSEWNEWLEFIHDEIHKAPALSASPKSAPRSTPNQVGSPNTGSDGDMREGGGSHKQPNSPDPNQADAPVGKGLIQRRMSYFNGEWIQAPKHLVDSDDRLSRSISNLSDIEQDVQNVESQKSLDALIDSETQNPPPQ
eukprot:TRINITY_DN5107_c0_g1_i6.p1 TRINITY_DN5107_c0_g1~~TRINITY_DN5107_c0_g1_i6.p1  ORF type:complete len:1069 (-),score=196.83 TRINITY_DN5107_c0_g1_i6:596-3802(-)